MRQRARTAKMPLREFRQSDRRIWVPATGLFLRFLTGASVELNRYLVDFDSSFCHQTIWLPGLIEEAFDDLCRRYRVDPRAAGSENSENPSGFGGDTVESISTSLGSIVTHWVDERGVLACRFGRLFLRGLRTCLEPEVCALESRLGLWSSFWVYTVVSRSAVVEWVRKVILAGVRRWATPDIHLIRQPFFAIYVPSLALTKLAPFWEESI